jgi:pimeloyl-ACP methyl ester carboxylesterase
MEAHMPYAATEGGRLFYEEAGKGYPIVFAHEFGGDWRSWEGQMRRFSRDYRCIAFNAVGYPPSDVPEDEGLYDYLHQVGNIAAVMRHLGIAKAHVVGLSMGAYSALHFGLKHPEMASALVVAGCGSGAPREHRVRFKAESEAMAARLERDGMAKVAPDLASSPTRIPFRNKDPRGAEEFMRYLAEHSGVGSARTLRRFQAPRPSLWDFEAALGALEVPTLLLIGDEDEPCIETNVFLKRAIPCAGLVVVPNTGHLVNLEEPALFNDAVASFLGQAERGTWPRRDPRSKSQQVFPGGRA